MEIQLTKHALEKIALREISMDDIRKTIEDPDKTRKDRLDPTIVHMIKKIDGKYLRVIGKWTDAENFLIISAFYDRRLLRGGFHDQDRI